MPTLSQTRAIHSLRRKVGLTEEDYRDYLQGVAGVTSSTRLSQQDAFKVIEGLKKLAGQGTTAAQSANRSRAMTATGQFAPILQALWIAGYHLGVVRSKDDAAMLAFVARQTGIQHTEFLIEPLKARKAIEALKSWLAREAGVEWPVEKRAGDDVGGIRRKHAVAKAITARLVAEGGFTPFGQGHDAWPRDIESYGFSRGLPAGFDYYKPEHWDRLAAFLGARLRAVLAKKSKANEAEAA